MLDAEIALGAPAAPTCEPVSVLLVDPVHAYAEAVALALRAVPGIGPVRVATHGADVVWLVADILPDVVVVSIVEDAGEATIRDIHLNAPHVGLVAAGAPLEPAVLVDLVEAGVLGFVHGDDTFTRLVEVLLAVARGEPVARPEVVGAVMRRLALLSRDRDAPRGPDLTERETQILRLVAAGLANQQIADELGISLRTVKNHVHNVLGKLGARRRGEAAATLWRLERAGLLTG